jgi:lysine-specific demethylase 8
LIRGHLHAQGWAALAYFASLDRLRAEHGRRLVPVNLGSPLVKYRGVVHMPLRRLIDDHLAPSIRTQAAAEQAAEAAATAALERVDGAAAGGPPPDEELHCDVAYMSQHHLLHQVPQLQELIALPPFLLGRSLSPVNVWLGTRGTVTSLHSDPDDNLLCQARQQRRPYQILPSHPHSCDCGVVASAPVPLLPQGDFPMYDAIV